MYRWTLAAVLIVTACGFQSPTGPLPGDAGTVGSGPPRPDGAMSTSDDVVHVGTTDEYTGTDDLTIAASITIDTDKMMFGMPLPPGVTFAAAKQDGGGSDLAILHVRALAVHASVRALGSRPLVVIADSIELTETIDVTAHQGQPGPGALSSGPGAGHDGQHVSPDTDSGGGGGSHGSVGAAGGNTNCGTCLNQRLDGGAAGDVYNPAIARLVGGSPGGSVYAALATCSAPAPGAGGGAIELYARTQISISGYINAGGGGGSGGNTCLTSSLGGGGGGGGGAIVLQSPSIENSGRLSANGGGGGAGASGGTEAAASDAQDGKDGTLGTAVATGGTASGPYGARGGNGATATTAATPGAPGATTGVTTGVVATGNGGGGGGGEGQIVMLYRTRVAAGVTSPTAITQPY